MYVLAKRVTALSERSRPWKDGPACFLSSAEPVFLEELGSVSQKGDML